MEILKRVGPDRFVEFGVPAADRLQNRNAVIHIINSFSTEFPQGWPTGGGDDCEQVVGGGTDGGQREPDHNETSATPQTTNRAPAQRTTFTCSFRTYFARTVSSTHVTA